MENVMRKALAVLSAFCVALMFASTTLSDASAREIKRSGSYKTGKGRTGTVQSQVNRSKGKVTRNQTITTQEGKTYDREVSRTYDKETGSYSGSVTGPQGKTRTTTGTVGADGTRTGTVTTSSGKTATVTSNVVRNEDGSVAKNTSVITENGKTLNRSSTASFDKETGTVSRTVTGAGGNTRTGSVTIEPDSSQ
jgi:hypothetical protein